MRPASRIGKWKGHSATSSGQFTHKVWTKKMLLLQKLVMGKKSVKFALHSWKLVKMGKTIVILLLILIFRLSSIFFGSHLKSKHYLFCTSALASSATAHVSCPGSLQKGDIYTHMYHGVKSSIYQNGRIHPSVIQ